MLYLVPTPIGNLGDITFRAIEILKSVDAVLAEDTRNTGKLMKHYQIDQKLIPFHAHNEHKTLSRIVERLEGGEDLALVSDAGMPGISDPGFLLVRACLEADIKVESLPGATAFVPALVNSGFPCERFCFEGFLPHKKGRKSRIEDISQEGRTLVFYESPHRIVKTLTQLGDVLGAAREASVSRELTKMHEENVRGTLASLADYFTQKPPKGEFVLVVKGYSEK
ncbi:MAG TPA: 16S rRNA (cytidine(1402)-2'-O)-methyltransferase [Cryomorphaceae bacterium]|nr:16S rRNA (cytidine(1402)-2'-O)-methyltransferase [Cryomorphaceae bacterium]